MVNPSAKRSLVSSQPINAFLTPFTPPRFIIKPESFNDTPFNPPFKPIILSFITVLTVFIDVVVPVTLRFPVMVTVGFALLPILIVVTFVAVPRLTSASVTGAAVGSFPACLFAAVLLTVVVTFCLSFFDPGGGGAIIILLNIKRYT